MINQIHQIPRQGTTLAHKYRSNIDPHNTARGLLEVTALIPKHKPTGEVRSLVARAITADGDTYRYSSVRRKWEPCWKTVSLKNRIELFGMLAHAAPRVYRGFITIKVED